MLGPLFAEPLAEYHFCLFFSVSFYMGTDAALV